MTRVVVFAVFTTISVGLIAWAIACLAGMFDNDHSGY